MMKQKSMCLLALVVFSLLVPSGRCALGLTVNYQYDDLYRLTRVEQSDGIVTEYQYDGAGNRVSRVIMVIIAGDINGDSIVTLADAVMTMQIVSGITPGPAIFQSAKVTGDDRVGLTEAIYILQKVSCLR
jgi:YD repeat-containing protein